MRWPRLPWWSWAAAVALGGAGVFALWFFSDSDWRRVTAYATERGVLLHERDLPHPPLDQQADAATVQVRKLSEAVMISVYESMRLTDDSQRTDLAKTLARAGPQVTQIESLCDGLPSAAFSTAVEIRWGVDAWRLKLGEVLAARAITCTAEELPTCMRRLLRVGVAGSGPDYSVLRIAVTACTDRLAEIKGSVEAADALQALIDGCIARRAVHAERMAAVLAQGLNDQTSPRQAARQLGIQVYEWETCWPLLAIEMRGQREEVLRSWIDHAVSLRDHSDPTTWPWAYQSTQQEGRTALSNLRCRPAWQRSLAKQLLRASLLVAEVRGVPWPCDWFDPSRSSLRRIERDGKLIGAYSVGYDGVDDGGRLGDDLCWPLYGNP